MYTVGELKANMADIKRQRLKVINNFYNNIPDEQQVEAFCTEHSVVFYFQDIGVKRCFFYSNEKEELISILRKLPQDAIFDYITRDSAECREVFEKAGFDVISEFRKMIPDTENEAIVAKRLESIRKSYAYNEKYVCYATHEDAQDIFNKLYEIFDPRESHFCSVEELKELIDKKWVYIFKDDTGEIKAIYIYKIEGKKKYGYQLYNGGDADIIYSLCMKADDDVRKLGIKYYYGWVKTDNKRAIRYNKFMGAKFDSLYDIIYEKHG